MQGDNLVKIFNFKGRKAISTIIGTFFFVIVMVGAFTAFILMMQTNSNFLNTQLDTSQNEIQKIQGQFTIAAAYDSEIGNRLCVSVKNAGSTPLEIADLFIVNKTTNEARQFDIDFRDAFVPVSSLRDILDNQPITLTADSATGGTVYDIKVVSTSGIVQTTELKVFPTAGQDPRLNVTGFVYPSNVASGQNVTVGMFVYNRANTTLINVQPNGDPIADPVEAVSLGYPLVTRGNITRLDPNEHAMFMWEPEFIGGVGSKITFLVRAKALVEGCTTSSYIFNDSSTTGREGSPQIKVVPGVRKEILASPETFISFPNPFGDVSGTQTAIFSIVVQNPTDHPFKVNQVSIQLVNPADEDLVTSVSNGVNRPATGWTEGDNIIVWRNTASPVTVNANDMEEWLVRATPTNIATTTPVTSIIYNTYSSFGQFGKGPFTHGVSKDNTAMVNTYSKTSFSGSTEIFAIKDVDSGGALRLNFTISNSGNSVVDSGAFMLINVPSGIRDITNVTTTAGTDGLDTGLEVRGMLEFDDGSVQIPIKLTSDLVAGALGTRTYSMRMIMPTISVPAFYTFTIVANGTASASDVIIGPTAEVIVQVCPTSGTNLCP